MAAQEVPFGVDEQLGIAEMLQIVGLRGRTGRLLLIADDGRAWLDFARGRIVGGDLLPALPGTDIESLPVEARSSARRADIQRVLIEVLGWSAGRAAFEGATIGGDPNAGYDVDTLLLDAVRTLDEWKELAETLPGPDECLVWAATAPVAASPISEVEIRVLQLSNGRCTLREVARRLHVADVDVLRAAAGLLDRQFVCRQIEDGAPGVDAEVEQTINRRAVELQVATAALVNQRNRERQVKALVGVLTDAVQSFIEPVQGATMASAEGWLTATLQSLQGQYAPLELLTLSRYGLDFADLISAYDAMAGAQRDAFYTEAIDGLYGLLLHLAVHVVEEIISSRSVAERVRGTTGALLLEIETAIHRIQPPTALPISADLTAVRQKHFHLVA